MWRCCEKFYCCQEKNVVTIFLHFYRQTSLFVCALLRRTMVHSSIVEERHTLTQWWRHSLETSSWPGPAWGSDEGKALPGIIVVFGVRSENKFIKQDWGQLTKLRLSFINLLSNHLLLLCWQAFSVLPLSIWHYIVILPLWHCNPWQSDIL